jgi:L,D-transpeptidase ErfK/SrfK
MLRHHGVTAQQERIPLNDAATRKLQVNIRYNYGMRRSLVLSKITLPVLTIAVLSGCSLVPLNYLPATADKANVIGPDPNAPRLRPLSGAQYENVASSAEVLGEMQVLFARDENTLAGLARQYDLGYQALRHGNPDVDPWLPREGTPVFLPTMNVIPDAPRDGILINLPSMRMMYFVPQSRDASLFMVTSHPIGIGREGWATPIGTTHITQKKRDPNWYPPASVRAEHAALGDPLPAVVPPGPDNPLGRFKMRLALPSYLIHGTNKPSGVGMRISHGCIRLYPEDIETLFDRGPPRTPVHIVDQPILAGWRDGVLYLEAHPPLAEDTRAIVSEANRVIAEALARRDQGPIEVNRELVATIVADKRGIPIPITSEQGNIQQYLAASRVIENLRLDRSENSTASR